MSINLTGLRGKMREQANGWKPFRIRGKLLKGEGRLPAVQGWGYPLWGTGENPVIQVVPAGLGSTAKTFVNMVLTSDSTTLSDQFLGASKQ